jgi:nucleoside-diphosphate-sugar epimerase
MDVSRLSAMGWRAGIDLRDGIEQTYRWFVDQDSGAIRAV